MTDHIITSRFASRQLGTPTDLRADATRGQHWPHRLLHHVAEMAVGLAEEDHGALPLAQTASPSPRRITRQTQRIKIN